MRTKYLGHAQVWPLFREEPMFLRGMMQNMFEIKAHMIERKPEAKGILDRLLDPFTNSVDWLISGVKKHPLIVILVFLALLFVVWRLNK